HRLTDLVACHINLDSSLSQRFFRLTDLRRSTTTLVDRDSQIEANRSTVSPAVATCYARKVGITKTSADPCLRTHLRKHCTLGHLHREVGSVDKVLRRLDRRMLLQRDRHCLFEVCRQKPINRRRCIQTARTVTDK